MSIKDVIIIKTGMSLVWLACELVENLTNEQVFEFIILLDEAMDSPDFTKELLDRLSKIHDWRIGG